MTIVLAENYLREVGPEKNSFNYKALDGGNGCSYSFIFCY